jgi:replicative DNA helicase
MSTLEEKMRPQNIEAEKGVLGSIILDPEVLVAVADFLLAEDFYRDAHRTMYEVILSLYARREQADLITISDALERRNKLSEVGGPGYITSLVNYVPTSANAVYYARLVQRTAILRRLIDASAEIVGLAYGAEDDASSVVDRAEQLIFEISRRATNVGTDASLAELLSQYYAKLQLMVAQRGQLTGVPSGFADLDRLTGGFRKSDLIVLAARPAIGKCLPAWTFIDHPITGERLTIEEYVQRQVVPVYGLSEDGRIRVTSISHWIDSGIKPCYRVRTKLGRMVEVTEHHPFLTVEGWKPLSELEIGCSIAVPSKLECFGNDESWDLDLVRLLAYYIAEGGLTADSPRFTNTDPVIIEDFKAIIAKHFPACAMKRERITYTVARPRATVLLGRNIHLSRNPVCVWLEALGLMGKGAKDKFFPPCVWKWSRRYLAEFLRVLMSCDGCIYSASGRPYLEFSVASERLAFDLQHAFTRFGILSRCYKRAISYQSKEFVSWRVSVTHSASIQIYQEEIGWIGEKATRFVEYTHKVSKRGGNYGHAPKETWQILRVEAGKQSLSLSALAYKSGETTRQGKYAGYHAHTNQSISRHRLTAFADALGSPLLRSLASSDIYWDEIVSIEPIGEHQVYDLSVPDGANFIAQDVFVHNTSCALSIAHQAAVTYGQRIGIFSLEMSQEQVTERLLALETGINLQRLNTGNIEDEEWDRVIRGINVLSGAAIRVDGTSVLSPTQMRSRARRWVQDEGIDLIIVDYMQLMQPGDDTRRKQENRVQVIDEISRNLKLLARELNIPLLVLAQLSRAVESRMSKVPQLSDLRESGGIENNADIVMFIYRDEVYNPDTDRKGYADIIIAKHRNGPIGQIVLRFEPETTRFRDAPGEVMPPIQGREEEIPLDIIDDENE